jgi:hypothetical protein
MRDISAILQEKIIATGARIGYRYADSLMRGSDVT